MYRPKAHAKIICFFTNKSCLKKKKKKRSKLNFVIFQGVLIFKSSLQPHPINANNQIWEAQGPWFSEIYVCKSGGGGELLGGRGSTGPAVYIYIYIVGSLCLLNDSP